MKFRSKLLAGCAVALASLTVAAEAHAQQPAAAEGDAVTNEGDIIVTARRRSETAQNTPVPLTVLNDALLERYSVKGIASIAQMTPGLLTGEASGSVGGSISLRGVGSGEAQPFIDQAVSVNVDGVQISTAQLLRAAELDLKQIEVLRGPQALFFGKNSPGGIISLTSADPGNRLEAQLKGGYEFRSHERYVDGIISGPLGDEVGVRIAGHYSKMNGYMKVVSQNVPATLTPYDLSGFPNQEEVFLRGTLAIHPSDSLSIRIKGTYTNTRIVGGTSYFSDIVACPYGTTPQTPAGTTYSTPGNCVNDAVIYTSLLPQSFVNASPLNLQDRHGGRTNKQALLTGIVEWKLSPELSLTSVSGYYGVREHLTSNGTYDVTAAYGFGVGFTTDQFSEELRLASKFAGPLNFLAGGYWEHRKLWTGTFIQRIAVGATLPTEYNRQEQTAWSAFGQLMFDAGPQLQLTAGGRYTHETKHLLSVLDYFPATGTSTDFALLPTYPGGPQPRVTFNNFSPEATLTWKPHADLMFFASYKQGFKSGGFDAAYTGGALAAPARMAAGQVFRPEKVKGGEVGMKSEWMGRQLTFNATAYWYDYADLQVSSFDNTANTFLTKNAAKARVRGVELESHFRPAGVPGLTINAALAYNDAKFVDYAAPCYSGQTVALGCSIVGGAAVQQLGGKALRKAPHWTGNLGGYYEGAIGAGMMASLSADLAYSSGYMASADYQPGGYQKGFAKLDASLRLFTSDHRYELALIGRNLTNQLNLVYVTDRPLTGNGVKGSANACVGPGNPGNVAGCGLLADLVGTPTQPRSVALQFTFKY
ncbi:MAG: TonB-dependent receptor [Sphingomonadales bacterium]|nr:TonB-dependent receptor [Sphingomonadales bacterium]